MTITKIIQELKDKDDSIRKIAAKAARKLKDDCIQGLIIHDRDNSLCCYIQLRAAQGAPEGLKDIQNIEHLITDLKDKNSDVRYCAARALGEIEDARAVEPLLAALKDKDRWVKYEAALALGKTKDAKAVGHLINAVEDRSLFSYYRRCAAIWALGEIKDARAVEPLLAALKDKDKNVRYCAEKALENFEGARVVESPATVPKGEHTKRQLRLRRLNIIESLVISSLLFIIVGLSERGYMLTGALLAYSFWSFWWGLQLLWPVYKKRARYEGGAPDAFLMRLWVPAFYFPSYVALSAVVGIFGGGLYKFVKYIKERPAAQ